MVFLEFFLLPNPEHQYYKEMCSSLFGSELFSSLFILSFLSLSPFFPLLSFAVDWGELKERATWKETPREDEAPLAATAGAAPAGAPAPPQGRGQGADSPAFSLLPLLPSGWIQQKPDWQSEADGCASMQRKLKPQGLSWALYAFFKLDLMVWFAYNKTAFSVYDSVGSEKCIELWSRWKTDPSAHIFPTALL